MSLLLLSKSEENKHAMTKMIREFSIEKSEKKKIVSREVFLVRVYNEASVLEKTLQGILDAGYQHILVVDDGSKDDSWRKVKKLTKKHE
jgi:cellulose synthase/poly-beta-1,6-N-acetylglucosamine synthase-like glycosyltransferase